MERYLFLNGGPGLSPLAERKWVNSLSAIEFWDAPRLAAGESGGFNRLCNAGLNALVKHAEDGPTVLVASSFAVHLALDLVRLRPDCVARLVLISPTTDPRAAYIRLAERINDIDPAAGIAELIHKVRASPRDAEAFWSMVAAVMGRPDFLDLYWGGGSRSRRELFKVMLREAGTFDFATFHAVLTDFLFSGDRNLFVKPQFDGPVSIIMGSTDPLCRPGIDEIQLLDCFPRTEVKILEGGHFLHLEHESKEWLR